LTTVVSPQDLTAQAVAGLVQSLRPTPPLVKIKRWELFYPELPSDPQAAFVQIRQMYAACERCHLADRRNRVVFLKGNPYAGVLVLGEGPGKDEDSNGTPFVGKSGRLADELFREIGIDPERDLAWSNIIGCRSAENMFAEDRKPSLVEAVACSERLTLTLRAIRPSIVLCLGAVAATAFFREEETPPVNTFTTLASADGVRVIVGVLRHPAYLLRIGQQPNMYGEWAGCRLALRQLRAWLPAQKIPTWPFGLRYIADFQTAAVGA
jgi:DNA polymerase